MNWSKGGRSWRPQKFIKICTWGKLPRRQEVYLPRQERAQEEHDEKCLVLHLSGGEGAEMAVCHHKYAIEKYVTKNIHVTECNQGMGGYSFKGFSCSAFPSKIANHCFDWDLNRHHDQIFVEFNSEQITKKPLRCSGDWRASFAWCFEFEEHCQNHSDGWVYGPFLWTHNNEDLNFEYLSSSSH